jgi:hypothetical protein
MVGKGGDRIEMLCSDRSIILKWILKEEGVNQDSSGPKQHQWRRLFRTQ